MKVAEEKKGSNLKIIIKKIKGCLQKICHLKQNTN